MRPSSLLLPLTPLYAAALVARNMAYARCWLRPARLAAPVISVGNLSVGGTGKTPFVQELARLLATRGYSVDILSRGYGRASTEAVRVDASAPGAASLYGDEPVLLAEAGLAVYVGAQRYRAGVLAERAPEALPRIHLLDDGFQHRRLARDVDIVLLHPADLHEHLLPGGRLREPPSALARAQIVVLREEDSATESALRARGLRLPVWRVARELVLPPALQAPPTPQTAPTRVVAFCGIARPEEFFAALIRAGLTIVAARPFPDHHPYTPSDVEGLVAQARAAQAVHLVTTEKDLVRLSPATRAVLAQAGALHAVPLQTRLLDPDACVAQLRALLEARDRVA